MAASVKWKEPRFISVPVVSLAIFSLLLPCLSHSQWISYQRTGRHSSSLWHPNMPAAPRTLRHSHSSSSSSSSGSSSRSNSGSLSRPIDHRSSNNANYYKDSPSSNTGGGFHQHQARYSSADFGQRGQQSSGSMGSGSSSSLNGKNIRISDVSIRASPSSPTAASHQYQQRSQQQIPSNAMSHRMIQAPKSKLNWQTAASAATKTSRSTSQGVHDSTRRPVSQQAGHLLDSWPNTNTHHHLAPVPASKPNAKNAFTNLKPEWGGSVLVSNKPIELKPKTDKVAGKEGGDNSKQASDRQLVISGGGYPAKDKAAVAKTINTLTKLSPKKPIFVFMRKEGILAVHAGADAGDVIKKLAGTSKLPFYNGTNAMPSHSIPTVFLAPEDMDPPNGYGKIPIPNLKPKTNVTQKPTYTKILMPGGTHMKGSLITTIPTTTTTSTTTPSPPPPSLPTNSAPDFGQIANMLQNNSINNLNMDQKLQLLQFLRSQPNNPLADQAALAILASASPSPSVGLPQVPSSPVIPTPLASSSAPIPSPHAPSPLPGLSPVVHGPNLAVQPGNNNWANQMFQGVLPPGAVIEGITAQNPPGMPPLPGINGLVISTTTLSPISQGSPVSPGPPGSNNGGDIHKLIGTIVESAVSNTVSTMLQHQRLLQQQSQPQPSIIGVGPPLSLQGSRPPLPPHFGRGPPHRPIAPHPPPPPRGGYGYQQRPHFPPSPTPGRFPPLAHPSAIPPQQPSAIPPNPSSPQPQQFMSSSSTIQPFVQPIPPSTTPQPQVQQTPNPSASPPFPPQQQNQFYQQQSSLQQNSYQHPIVPQFQLPPGYPTPTTLQPVSSTTLSPSNINGINPSSTISPPFQFQQQQFHQQFPHPNGIRVPPHNNGKPLMRLVERPFPNRPRNPLHNTLQFYGSSTPRPDLANKSPIPSSTPQSIMSSTPYPNSPFTQSQPPFRQTPPGQQPFPSSTPAPQFRHTPTPPPFQSQQQQNGPPQQHNFPPQQQQNGPPRQHNFPPQQQNGPPQQHNFPPQQQNGQHQQHNFPPQQQNGPHQQHNFPHPPQQAQQTQLKPAIFPSQLTVQHHLHQPKPPQQQFNPQQQHHHNFNQQQNPHNQPTRPPFQQHQQFNPNHHQQQPNPNNNRPPFQQQHPPFPPQMGMPPQLHQQQPPAKKNTLIVQTPNGVAGKKNTYVITGGGGQELPELNKIMKVLNDLNVDSENSPAPPKPQQFPSSPIPSPTTPRPTLFSPSPTPTTPRPTIFSPSPTPTVFLQTGRSTPFMGMKPTPTPNVMIKNANSGITPSPAQIVSSVSPQQFFSTSTPQSVNPSSIRSPIVSSTTHPPTAVSPMMHIIKQIQSQIPGAQVAPSIQTVAQKQQNQQHHLSPSSPSPRPILLSSPHPLGGLPSASPSPIIMTSPRPPFVSASPSHEPIMFSSPRPISPSASPTPTPGQIIISSTGFPRVINVSPSAGSATPSSIHQAVVEAIMKQQAAEAGGSPTPGQIIVSGGPRGGSPSPTPQLIEVIPAGGDFPGLDGIGPSANPFLVQLQQQDQNQEAPEPPIQLRQPPSSREHVDNTLDELPSPSFDLGDPNIHIQKGSLESHETIKHKLRRPPSSSSGSYESSAERQRAPVYSREKYGSKIHHHSKEVSDEYPEKNNRRPSYQTSKEQYEDDQENFNPNRRMYSGESSKQETIPSEEAGASGAGGVKSMSLKQLAEMEKLIEKVITEEKIVWKQGPGEGELIPAKVRTEERFLIRPGSKELEKDSEFSQRRTPLSSTETFANMARHGSSQVQQQQQQSAEGTTGNSGSSQSMSKELQGLAESPSNFAGILRSKMKFDKLMERLYPTKQLVSPFTIQNNSATFPQHPNNNHNHPNHRPNSGETVPTIASSIVTTTTTKQETLQPINLSSVSPSPTMPSLLLSSLGGLLSSPSPTQDTGRFKIKPGDISITPELQKAHQQNIVLGVSPSGQPMIIQSSPSSPMVEQTNPIPSILPSPTSSHFPSPSSTSGTAASSTVEQRLVFIPQGTAASSISPTKSNKPQILITTVDELPDLMAQLSGTNPEIRMVPDKATLEAELAKVAATSTIEARTIQTQPPTQTTTSTTTTTTTTQPPPPPTTTTRQPIPDMHSIQSHLFRLPAQQTNQGIRRMDGPDAAFTWRPAAINSTMASPVSTTMSFDTSRRLVSGLGAGMLHAMSAGFGGNLGNGVMNKFSWLAPSPLPPQQAPPQLSPQPPTTQVLYTMQNGVPVPISVTTTHNHNHNHNQHSNSKLAGIGGPYQQLLINNGNKDMNPAVGGGAPLGYYSYKWGGLLPEQPPTPTNPSTIVTSTSPVSTTTTNYKLMYRSQYKQDEIAPTKPEEKIIPVATVHKLKKGVKARVKTTTVKTTPSPIDPISAEEYEDESDDVEQDLMPHDTLVPKHAGRGKPRHQQQQQMRDEDSSEASNSSEESDRRRQDTRRNKHRRRRPGKLTTKHEDEEEEFEEEHIKHSKKNSKARPRPTKPTYDEEDDASPAPKPVKKHSNNSPHGGKYHHHNHHSTNSARRRMDENSNEDMEFEEDEDYEMYDVKPVYDVKRKKHPKEAALRQTPPPTTTTTQAPSTTSSTTVSPPKSTTKSSSRNKAIYVNRDMFMVSGEDRNHREGTPKAEPVYQPNPPTTKFSLLQGPSIIGGQSVVVKSGPSSTTPPEPKPTHPSTTVSTTVKTSPVPTKKIVPPPTTKPVKKHKDGDLEDYKETQDELKSLLKKIQDRLTAQDEVYDFGEDGAFGYDYYEDIQQLSTKATAATTTTTTSTKGTIKPKKKSSKKNPKKGGKKEKKNGKKNKKNKKGKKKDKKKKNPPKPKNNNNNNKKVQAITKSIPTRKPVTTTLPPPTTPKVYLKHHQRHPVSSLEQFTSSIEEITSTTRATTTTTSQTTPSTTLSTTTTTPKPTTTLSPPPPPPPQSLEEQGSSEAAARAGDTSSQSGSVESSAGVQYVFPENGKDNLPKLKRRPLWVRRRVGGMVQTGVGSGEGLQSVRTPNSPPGKVIRLVRRKRPLAGRRRLMHQRRQQYMQGQSYEQQEAVEQPMPSTTPSPPSTSTAAPSSTHASIEVAPPNYSSPPLEQYFEQNSLERRVGNSDPNEGGNGTVTLRSPKRKLKLIRLKGQRAQWRLRLQGSPDEESSSYEAGGPRPAALIAPREVSAPLPLQAPLPSPVYNYNNHHNYNNHNNHQSSSNSARSAKSASDMVSHYKTSFRSSESESSSVETKVCIRGKCEIVSRQ